MSIFNKYPYTDFHELNLDWVIEKIKELATNMEEFTSTNEIKYADPIAWDIASQYEANTVVVNGTTSYLSKKPVPAGIDISNTDYWILVGDFETRTDELQDDLDALTLRVSGNEGNISNLQGRMNTAEGNISNLNTRVTNLETDIAVLLGDSYGYGYAADVDYGWCDLVPQYLSGVYTCKTLAYGGAGFTHVGHGRTFITMLSEIAVTMTDNEKAATKKVVVGGGWNDMGSDQNINTVKADVKTFVTNAKTLFPNADIIICGMGWTRNGSLRHKFYGTYLPVIRDAACECGASFTIDAIKPLHWYDYIGSDNTHPTQDGEYAISRAMTSIIVNGSYSNFYKGDVYNGTNTSNLKTTSASPTLYVGMDNEDIYVQLSDVTLDFNETNIYTNQWVEVATFHCPLLAAYNDQLWGIAFNSGVACANYSDITTARFYTSPVQVGFIQSGTNDVKMFISIREAISGYLPVKLGRVNLYSTVLHLPFDLC